MKGLAMNKRALDLVLLAKGRYPSTDDVIRDAAIVLGHYAGVDPSTYTKWGVAKIVVEDLCELVQKTCRPSWLADLLLRMCPGHAQWFGEGVAPELMLVDSMLRAIQLGVTTTQLEAAGIVLPEPDESLAAALRQKVETSEAA